jgi:hypothetical protein
MMATLRRPKHLDVMSTNICCVFDWLSPFLYDLPPKTMIEYLEF